MARRHHLMNPDTGELVAATTAGADVLRRRGYVDADVGIPVEADTEPAAAAGDERPSKTASRGEWDDFARSVGLDPDDFASKGDLINAVDEYLDADEEPDDGDSEDDDGDDG